MAFTFTVTDPPADGPNPTTTYHEKSAADFLKALDDITRILPKVEPGHISAVKFMRAHANVPDQFCATAVAGIEQVPELLALGKLDTVAGRDALQFIEAYRPVRDKADAFVQNLSFLLMGRKAEVASESLQVYQIAKGLARNARGSKVAAFVANLKRDLNRTRVAKEKEKEVPKTKTTT